MRNELRWATVWQPLFENIPRANAAISRDEAYCLASKYGQGRPLPSGLSALCTSARRTAYNCASALGVAT